MPATARHRRGKECPAAVARTSGAEARTSTTPGTHAPSRICHDTPDGSTSTINAATGITTPRTTSTVLRANRTAAATTATASATAVTTFDIARSAGTQSTYRSDPTPTPWTPTTGSVPAARTLATTRGHWVSASASRAL